MPACLSPRNRQARNNCPSRAVKLLEPNALALQGLAPADVCHCQGLEGIDERNALFSQLIA